MKTKVPQFELPAVGSEAFNLVIESAVDGELVTQESKVAAQNVREVKELEKKLQPNLI